MAENFRLYSIHCKHNTLQMDKMSKKENWFWMLGKFRICFHFFFLKKLSILYCAGIFQKRLFRIQHSIYIQNKSISIVVTLSKPTYLYSLNLVHTENKLKEMRTNNWNAEKEECEMFKHLCSFANGLCQSYWANGSEKRLDYVHFVNKKDRESLSSF